ncbi:MAG: methionine adenosyltransferase [Ignavibacteriaceae bacterium]|nr:methionine adenosyltransferase [Ignavibacteriaceae bacterium]
MSFFFTSESVSEGHPDKVSDAISDSVLDAYFSIDPNARVACETFVTTGTVIIGGEYTVNAKANIDKFVSLDLHEVIRDTINNIGYNKTEYKFDAGSCGISNLMHGQSGDIAMGVDTGGAGDQGIMFGYACDQTPELMPMPIMFSHKLVQRLAEIRKKEAHLMPYLRPDAKSQVTIEYSEDKKPLRIDAVVVSTQHDPDVTTEKLREDIKEILIKKTLPADLLDNNTKYHINPTGRFEIGGPHGDSGLTGRKIIVDTYGGWAPHGGGAFSGKDPSKVDRSATYAARHIAKNVVAAGLATECLVQVSYAIGVAEPVSIFVDTKGTGKIPDHVISSIIKNEIDLTPKGIIERLKLRRPVYKQTAAYGHFGRKGDAFTWEELDLVDLLLKKA